MEECPICFEEHSLIILDCGHSFCRGCLRRWRITCPVCRQEQSFSVKLFDFTLDDFKSNYIDINIKSIKGESLPLGFDETNKLQKIFGDFSVIRFNQILKYDRIMIQHYKSNCWFIGVVKKLEDSKVKIDKSIYIKRNTGSIFYTRPEFVSLELSNNDKIFKIRNFL